MFPLELLLPTYYWLSVSSYTFFWSFIYLLNHWAFSTLFYFIFIFYIPNCKSFFYLLTFLACSTCLYFYPLFCFFFYITGAVITYLPMVFSTYLRIVLYSHRRNFFYLLAASFWHPFTLYSNYFHFHMRLLLYSVIPYH